MGSINVLLLNMLRRVVYCALVVLGGFILYWVANQFLPLHEMFATAVETFLADVGMSTRWFIATVIGLLFVATEVIAIAHSLYRTWKLPRISKTSDGRYVKTQGGNETPATRPETLAYDNMQIIRAKLGMPESLRTDLFVEEDNDLNAYTLGMEVPTGGTHALCLTSSLLETLPSARVAAVVAHEMGHVQNQDSATSIFMGSFRSLVSCILFAPIYLLYLMFFLLGTVLSFVPLLGIFVKLFLFASALLIVLLRLLEMLTMWPAYLFQQYVSLKNEFRADAVAARSVGPASMCQVLFLLSQYYPPRGKSVLFNLRDKLKILHATHPPLEDRIRAIKRRTYA